jgi:DNA invertase Pin-like site-specific DNA recombinase
MRVALYARYSSDTQSAASIEDQLRLCRQRAEREGWTVAEVFTDAALSGATTLRPGYQALLARLRQGGIDIVLTESLDRISRDQEHIARFYKLASFAGVRIVTLAEGEISELHIGLKGTMGALYLKDLADKTRRGEAGRILQGRHITTPAYGYRIVVKHRPDGERERGLREIDAAEAAVVRGIFRDYAAGASPRAIARALNAQGIPGPSGGLWYAASIRGRPTRQDGILRNCLYIGRLAWNRRRTLIDPHNGSRIRRLNPATDLIEVEVPELRIIDQTLWEAVQRRLAREAVAQPRSSSSRNDGSPTEPGFWNRRRPRHLLTGKVVCGGCRGPYAASGKDYLACQAAVHGACSNRRSIRRHRLESRVLAALRRDLMDPDAVASFIEAFNEEWRRLEREAGTQADAARRDLAAAERKLANLVDAIADGLRHTAIQRQLDELEARCAALRARIAEASPLRPVLPPNLAQFYRDRVADLEQAVADRRAPDVLEAARALIHQVVVHPADDPDGEPRIELEGSLADMLTAGGAALTKPPGRQADSPADLDLFRRSVKEASGGSALWGVQGDAPALASLRSVRSCRFRLEPDGDGGRWRGLDCFAALAMTGEGWGLGPPAPAGPGRSPGLSSPAVPRRRGRCSLCGRRRWRGFGR